MDKSFVKLSDLVNNDITVEKSNGFKYKMWDSANNKMLVSDSWEKGYQKRYTLETDKGIVEVSQSNMGNLLEGVVYEGKADIIGRTFHIKSNGQSGKDIRYFLNATDKKPAQETTEQPEW